MNNDSNIIDINEAEFNDAVVEASSKKLIIVDFWAPWCGPCKQLTPVLEKVAKSSADKITLVKINIDENQQIAAQLRIQSIPTVYAFKDKQIVDAFQGALPEKKIIEFIEKSLGEKLQEDFSEFYKQIKNNIANNNFEETKDVLLEFISKNSKEIEAITLYLDCLIGLKEFAEVETFIESLEEDIQDRDEIKQIIKKINIVKNNSDGPDIKELLSSLEKNPNDINIVIQVADKYFSLQEYKNCLELLLQNYPKNKDKAKNKMVEIFGVLGNSNEYTVEYRKKLSRLMFS